jgi:uncharacterized protein involved in response to NO
MKHAQPFRPFFLLAALSALILIGAWLAALSGSWRPAGIPAFWHARELIFGFMGAVLAGFFGTAAPKWTGSSPLTGWPLLAIVLAWIPGRFGGPELLPFALAAWTGWMIFRASSWRNLLFPVLLTGLGLCGVWLELDVEQGSRALSTALHLLLAIVVIFGGRITPMFTRSALHRAGLPFQPRERTRLDDGVIALTLLAVLAVAILDPGPLLAAALGLAGLANLVRMWGWGGSKSLGDPMLWSLHLGYAWVGLGLLIEAASALGWLPMSTALHAISVGALSATMYTMLTRVALGHTGRPLKAHVAITVGYMAISLAALVRVFLPLAWPAGITTSWHVAGGLWMGAFALYLAVYVPVLLRPRVDGKPG